MLAAHQLATDVRGRRAYVDYLEARATGNGGEFPPEATAALRRGWYLGDESFRDRLLAMVRKGGNAIRRSGSHSGAAVVAHGVRKAERLVTAGLRQLALCDGKGKPLPSRKGDPRKVALATLLRAHTAMNNEWVAKRLDMGHDKSVSRLIRQGRDQREVGKCLRSLEQMLPCEDPICHERVGLRT